ncbi:Polycomb group RING finger protein 3 [Hypsibius exemplaris]|uniref:Polycomb group RING finger protein 3 n=1 Tax=Hypsibius exemplaris TaxID=2072580 RepID=A0A1W0X363_HYPEX|nr:Polycomb group RING finger protein 3 [Hypsibius exemplaris]
MAERRIRMRSLLPIIQCRLCKGCIVDATTIKECLHSFCKSCLVKYLQKNRSCPKCEILIHQSHPLDYIGHDHIVQKIVSKIFPHLDQDEKQRELQYYLQNPNRPNPKKIPILPAQPVGRPTPVPVPVKLHDATDSHRKDKQLSVQLECKSQTLKPLERRYLRCSHHSTGTLIRKFIAAELFDDISRWSELDIECNGQLLGKDHTLQFVELTCWRFRDPPLVLHYRQKMVIS